MNFFTWKEIWDSLFLSIAFGAAFSIAASLFFVVLASAKEFCLIFARIPKYCRDIKSLPELFKGSAVCEEKISAPMLFVFDFVRTVCYGVLFSVVLYVGADGIFRIYMLLASLAVSYALDKLVGARIRIIGRRVIRFVFGAIAFAVSLVIFPFAAPIKLFYVKFLLPRVKIIQEKVAKYSKKRSKNTPKSGAVG